MTSAVRAGLIGAGIGGASMFLLDPDRGARRRALVRDKAVWAARKTRDAAGATGRDLNNRLAGLQARTRAQFSDEPADDVRLCERVRATLGRVTSHPRALCVQSQGGRVTLTGDALKAEVPSIVSAVGGVRGVESVENKIDAHAAADGIPALQGRSERRGSWTGWARGGWSPTAILLAGASVATGAIAIAAARARANGYASNRGAARPATDEEIVDGLVTEIGILTVAVPTEPGTFGSDEFAS